MAVAATFIVSLALAILIFAVIDKVVGWFIGGLWGCLVTFLLATGVIWISSSFYTPALLEAFSK